MKTNSTSHFLEKNVGAKVSESLGLFCALEWHASLEYSLQLRGDSHVYIHCSFGTSIPQDAQNAKQRT